MPKQNFLHISAAPYLRCEYKLESVKIRFAHIHRPPELGFGTVNRQMNLLGAFLRFDDLFKIGNFHP